ncbi:MAG: hypothetical protein U5K31_09515 [Balneolaceae bacterium]|nr:hypothetical protein [Balneolaceae bacterium]
MSITCVAGSQGVDQGTEGQQQLVVPGAQDTHHTQGLVFVPGGSRQQEPGAGHPLSLHPAPQVQLRVADLVVQRKELQQSGLVPGPSAEVGVQRARKPLLPLSQLFQLFGARAPAVTGRASGKGFRCCSRVPEEFV